MNWEINHFSELNKDVLYDLLVLRSRVFVVEQNCPYQDVDGKDSDAYHVTAYDNDQLIAYCRILKAGVSYDEISIGRVLVEAAYRKDGYGKILMEKAIRFVSEELKATAIRISAQAYLKNFYEGLGFKQVSEIYLEDDIPHLEMLYKT